MKHHAEQNEAVAARMPPVADLLEAGGVDALERFRVLVGEGLVSSIATSIKTHVDGNPKMVESGCRVLSQLIEAKMSEATEDQENAGAAAAQGSRAQAPKAAKTKRKKKRGGKHRKKVDKAGQNATNKGIKDARILLRAPVASRALLRQCSFMGWKNLQSPRRAPKRQLDSEGQSRAPENTCITRSRR